MADGQDDLGDGCSGVPPAQMFKHWKDIIKHLICISEVSEGSIKDNGHIVLGAVQTHTPWPEVFVIHRGTKGQRLDCGLPFSGGK